MMIILCDVIGIFITVGNITILGGGEVFFAEIESLNGFYQRGLIKTVQASA